MDTEKYNTAKDKIGLLKKLLGTTDKTVLNGHIFRLSVSQNFDKNGSKISDNSCLGDEFNYYLKSKLLEIESATLRGTPTPENMLKFVGFCGFNVLHNNFYFNTDKKLVSRILEVCKKLPSICLYGNVMWFPEQFLLEHLPVLSQNVDKRVWTSFSPNRQNYLQLKSSSAAQDIKQFHLQLNGWMMQVEEVFTRGVNNLTLDHLQQVATLLLQGLEIADTIRTNISTILNLHGKLSKVIKDLRIL
jgi:WASH complex subunit 7